MGNYTVIIKTGEAEIRALENTKKETLDKVFPLIELTRGRKVPGKTDYPFDKRLDKVKNIFAGHKVAFDLTSDENLSSDQINYLYNPRNGYENWIKFLVDLKNEKKFKEIIPCIILNADDPDFYGNFKKEVQMLGENFSQIIYRNDILDENCYDDLEMLQKLPEYSRITILIDCNYVIPSAITSYSEKIIRRIININKSYSYANSFILSSTSYPSNVNEFGHDDKDIFVNGEILLYNAVKSQIKSDVNIIYSDYGTVNPVRNDRIVMARGWIPRIDVPITTKIYYYRKRRPRGERKYAETYSEVARLVVNDKRFPINLKNNWGIVQILNCSEGAAPSSRPGFWISVRMCIHIEQQVNRLFD